MLLVAHRTPSTAAGCAELFRAGARIFEVDVQVVGGSVVVSHYLPALGLPGWLEHDNWKLRLFSRGNPRDPELAETVARVPDECDILIDPKETAAARRAELIDRVAATVDPARCVVSTSFDGDLRRYRAAGFRTWRTIGTARHLSAVLSSGPRDDDGVSVRHTLLNAATVRALHGVVPDVVAWTVNTVQRAGQLRDMGVDGLTTDVREVMTYAAA